MTVCLFLGDNVSLKSSLLVMKISRIFTCNTCMHTIICKNLVSTDTVILKICWKKTFSCIEHGINVCMVMTTGNLCTWELIYTSPLYYITVVYKWIL